MNDEAVLPHGASGRKRVLVLVAKYSGDYGLLNSMVLGLDPKRYDAKVCYLNGRPDGRNALDALGKAVYLEDGRGGGGPKVKTLFSLVRLLKRERPHILHCHRHKATLYGAIAARMAGSSVVVSHDHGTRAERLRNPKRRITTWVAYRWVDRVITVSERGREDFLKTNPSLEPSRVTTVWNGIDMARFGATRLTKDAIKKKMGVEPTDLVFGTVGRLASKKGHSYLIDAFGEIPKDMPSARLVIMGGGPLLQELTDKVRRLGLSSGVRLLGYRKDVPELLSGLDVFVFPSFSEGLPLALLEGMASGLPVVMSDGRGMPEIFGEGGFGRMVPAGDAAAFASAMKELGGLTENERRGLGEAARKRVCDGFTKEIMCRRLMDVYGQALTERAS